LERITKDGSRVYKTPSGKSYPSVTTVTGLLKRKAIHEWREKVGAEEANKIAAKASARGTRIHGLCEDYLSNKEVAPSYIDSEMWQSITPHLDGINNIHALESKLYSDKLEVAGTVDCIAEYKGKLSVIDFKTSSRAKTKEDIHDYFMQCSAYAVAFEERTKIPVDQLVIIMAVENESSLLFFENKKDWIKQFKKLREEYRACKGL
jgi:genome maintenance exonuclease 1